MPFLLLWKWNCLFRNSWDMTTKFVVPNHEMKSYHWSQSYYWEYLWCNHYDYHCTFINFSKSHVSPEDGTVKISSGCIYKVQSGERDHYLMVLTLLFYFNCSMSMWYFFKKLKYHLHTVKFTFLNSLLGLVTATAIKI